MTKVLVTGCGGFLGRHIVAQLLQRGDEVVGVSRGTYASLENQGMSHRCGDLTDATWTIEHFGEVDAVIHTAAIAGVWGKREVFESINDRATRNVIEACRTHQIPRLVFTSSPSVTFDGKHQSGVDESVPYPTNWLCDYPRTKASAEQAVLGAHDEGGLVTCALRPHLIWGEGDPHLLPRLVARAKSGRLRIVGDGNNKIDAVHVIDAATAHLNALDAIGARPDVAGGRAYFITQDEPVDCWTWLGQLCEVAGVARPTKQISFSSAYRIGACLEMLYRISGRKSEPPMTRFVAAQLAKDHHFDISAAKERLGYRPSQTMDEAMQRTTGYLKSLS